MDFEHFSKRSMALIGKYPAISTLESILADAGARGNQQPCIIADFSDCECDCECFRPTKKFASAL